MKFSRRTAWNTEESELAQAHRERLAAGLSIADLTASNPTRCGFEYPDDLLAPLTDPKALDYDPEPKGSLAAREAVCGYYADHDVMIEADRIILTTSTSEAYSYLLKLLCDPGDAILVPQPSYPLFDFLADAEVVRLDHTSLVYDHGWQLDLEGLRRQIEPETRAVVLVHPNNPTGHFTRPEQARELAAICREHGLALIVDEVFLDYGLNARKGSAERSFAALELDVLTFVVSGISKIVGLPQMKLAWLLAVGPGSGEALARLEVLADTYLSMNAPIQRALPVWLKGRSVIQEQIRLRVRENLAQLDRALDCQEADARWVSRLEVEGGWYAVLRTPATQLDERTTGELLGQVGQEGQGVWVHPGYFFGMRRSGWLVVSLLTRSEEFAAGIAILLGYFRGNQKSYQRG
jgi:alanine-synthesizing transaminase